MRIPSNRVFLLLLLAMSARGALSQKLPSEARGASISQVVMLSPDDKGCAAGIVVGSDDKSVYIATAAHIITDISKEKRPPVTVRFYGLRDTRQGRFFPKIEPPNSGDLAVVLVDRDEAVNKFLDGLNFAMLSPVAVSSANAPVTSIGCFGGTFWALGAEEALLGSDHGYLQIQSNVNEGQSGGGLFNEAWELIGMPLDVGVNQISARPIAAVLNDLRTWGVPMLLTTRPLKDRVMGADELAREKASESQARQLAAQSEYLRQRPGQLTLASLLGLESLLRLPTLDGRNAVASALDLSVHERDRLMHEAPITQVAISPDGKWLVTASDDHTARIWDAATGQLQARLAHGGPVTAVAISPDSKWLVTASDDHTARIWDAATGRERSRLVHEGSPTAVAISPDGKWLATVSVTDQMSGGLKWKAEIWDANTGEERNLLKDVLWVYRVAISPDGKWLATLSDDYAKIWDASTAGSVRELAPELPPSGPFSQPSDGARAVAISPDHTWLVAASFHNSAWIWDAATGQKRAVLGHDHPVNALAISPDGKWLVTGSGDHTARTWDAATGRQLTRLVHEGSVNGVAISPDGKWLLTASDDHTARIWDATTGRERGCMEHQAAVNAVAISPDGKWLVTASDDHTARIWDANTGRERTRLEQDATVNAMVISPDGKWLAIASSDNTARIRDVTTGQQRARLQHEDSVNAVAVSPNGRWLATGSHDRTARIWEATTGRQLARLPHEFSVNAVAISPDGKWLATGSGRLVPATPNEAPSVIPFLGSSCEAWGCVSFLRTWDPTTGRERALLDHDHPIRAVAISPDGIWLATADALDNRIARIRDAATGKERVHLADKFPVNVVAFTHDGKFLITGGDDHTVRIVDVGTGKAYPDVLMHQDSIQSVVVSADDKWLIVTSLDRTVHIWNLSSHLEYLRLHFDSVPSAATFVPDMRLIAFAAGRVITFEPWKDEDLVHDLCARVSRNLTRNEWEQYIGNEQYRRTCLNLPEPILK